jgi:hypothetical protein
VNGFGAQGSFERSTLRASSTPAAPAAPASPAARKAAKVIGSRALLVSKTYRQFFRFLDSDKKNALSKDDLYAYLHNTNGVDNGNPITRTDVDALFESVPKVRPMPSVSMFAPLLTPS